MHIRLHKQKNHASIASITRDSGFWHMGQLYKDYKTFFGELPSKTLSDNH
ncbi:helix-turn-helix domain-containing protein [Algibacter mikhailovii]|nr:helix-turn-helix domain-containing protein [Algibacter mikhailovii]